MAIPTLAPNSAWFSQGGTTVKRASITQINIVDSYTPTGSETASWDASAAKDGGVMCYVNGTVLTIAGNGSGKIYANEDSSYAFADTAKKDYFSTLKAINGGNLLDTSRATTFNAMFRSASALTTIDVGNWDTSNVTSFRIMFQKAYAIGNLDVSRWNTGKVKDMAGMFNITGDSNTNLTYFDVSGWDVSEVTSIDHMFFNCSGLQHLDVSNWDVSKVTTMGSAFSKCSSLQTLDVSKWDTSSCTDMSYAFDNCSSLQTLDASNWDISKVADMEAMFLNCSSLKSLDVSKWNTASCTTMAFMLYNCSGIDSLDVSNWDVSKVTTFDHMMAHSNIVLKGVENWRTPSATNMNAMFHTIGNAIIDVSNFNTSKVQHFSQMFEYSGKLTSIKGLENFDTSNGLGFDEMFNGCANLRELNLSSFDTRKAKDGVTASPNGHLTATMKNMFNNMRCLKKIALGENFSFNGDGTTTANAAVLPTPNPAYIKGADGNWYDSERNAYAPATIPNKTAGTYYASLKLLEKKTEISYAQYMAKEHFFHNLFGYGLVGWKLYNKGLESQQTRTGKNLFDISRIQETARISHGGPNQIIVSWDGNANGNGYAASKETLKDIAPGLVIGKQYTFSFETESSSKWIYLSESKVSWRHGECKTVDQAMLDSQVAFYGMAASKGDPQTDCIISNIQIEEGTTATEYEPYVGGNT